MEQENAMTRVLAIALGCAAPEVLYLVINWCWA